LEVKIHQEEIRILKMSAKKMKLRYKPKETIHSRFLNLFTKEKKKSLVKIKLIKSPLMKEVDSPLLLKVLNNPFKNPRNKPISKKSNKSKKSS